MRRSTNPWHRTARFTYGIPVDGILTPLDLRMPGYPAYLV